MTCDKKMLAVATDVPVGLKIKGDPFLLHQAISNLIQNSIDFSLPGGRIELENRPEGGVRAVLTLPT